MDGKSSGSFWQSTSALIAAAGTLVAAVTGLGAFLVGQQLFGFGSGEPPLPGELPAQQVEVKLDNRAVRYQGDVVVADLMFVDFDQEPVPGRDTGSADLYHWGSGDFSAVSGAYLWPEVKTPTAGECATYLLTHGLTDHFQVDTGTQLCVRTNEGRTVLVVFKERQGNNWVIQTTVWRDITNR